MLQLFQNLLGNALKYRGERPPIVLVYAIRENGHWKVGLSDNGIGIAPSYLVSIFDLFKRLHTNEEYSGSGIGLALYQKIVERYGGVFGRNLRNPGKARLSGLRCPDHLIRDPAAERRTAPGNQN